MTRRGLRVRRDDPPAGEARPDPLGALGRLVGRGDRQGSDELLAAVARDQVLGPGRLAEHAGHLAEHGVAGVVAERVVDPLEVVDVEHQDRQAEPRDVAEVGQRPDLVEEERPVVQAGQRVAHGPLEHLALEPLVAGVEADELDDDRRAEPDAVAVVEPGGACGASRPSLRKVPLVLPRSVSQTSPWPSVTNSN